MPTDSAGILKCNESVARASKSGLKRSKRMDTDHESAVLALSRGKAAAHSASPEWMIRTLDLLSKVAVTLCLAVRAWEESWTSTTR